ncbi:MAG: acyltransferase [Christensenellaceae bacterium]
MEDEFEKELNDLLVKRRNDMKAAYNRVLPTGELLFNRFDKAHYLGAGENSSVYDSCVVMGEIAIGSHVWIGPYTLIEGINGKVTIGDFVSINSGVMIFTHDSTKYYLSGGKNAFEKGDVHIGSNTVVGSMSMIGCGVEIGKHCLIAANSVVTKNVPDFCIVAGSPAKIIGEVLLCKNGEVELTYFKTENK